jgi:hypothetical protein
MSNTSSRAQSDRFAAFWVEDVPEFPTLKKTCRKLCGDFIGLSSLRIHGISPIDECLRGAWTGLTLDLVKAVTISP